jgi:hypothetical protein
MHDVFHFVRFVLKRVQRIRNTYQTILSEREANRHRQIDNNNIEWLRNESRIMRNASRHE